MLRVMTAILPILQAAPAPELAAAQPWYANLALLALGVSTLSLLVSGLVAYFHFRTHQSKKPVVNIELEELPPYENKQSRTLIRVKNVGTSPTTRDLQITVDCSWMPLVSYRLNFPTVKYCLDPNEIYWWRIRLNDQLVPNSVVRVTVWDSNRDHWEQHQILNTPDVVSSPVEGSGTLNPASGTDR